jgi:hypothetical protein
VTIEVRRDFLSRRDVLLLDADTSEFRARKGGFRHGLLPEERARHVALIEGLWRVADRQIVLLFETWEGRTFQFVSRELLNSLNAKVSKLSGTSFDFQSQGTPVTAVGAQTLSCGSSAYDVSDGRVRR